MFVYESQLVLNENVSSRLACNAQFLAFSPDENNLTVCNLSNLNERVDLRGHHGELTALCFNEDFVNGCLCSAADEIILWRVADIKLSLLTKEFVKGSVLSSCKNKINFLTISKDGMYVGACCEDEIQIYSTKVNALLRTVKHYENLNCAMFTCQELMITAITNNNTLKVWSVKTGSLLCNLTCEIDITSVETYEKTLMLGSLDGLLRIYEYSRKGEFKVFHDHDLKKYCLSKDECSERYSVLFIKHFNNDTCFIGMPEEVLQMDVKCFQIKVLFKITDSLESIDGASHYLNSLSQITISKSVIPDKATFVMKTDDNVLHLVSYWLDDELNSTICQEPTSIKNMIDTTETCENQYSYCGQECDNLNLISVISREPLLSNSILKRELKVKAKPLTSKVASKGLKQGNMDKNGKILDKQPLVYHKNIRSSGYTEKKKSNSKLEKEGAPSLKEELQFPSSQEFIPNLAHSQYILDDPLVSFKAIVKVSETSSAINKMSFAGNGTMLLCSSTDGIISLLKRKKDSYFTEKAFHAHNHLINQVQFSNDSKWFISCGDDEKALVFDSKKCSPVLTLNCKSGNFPSNGQQHKLKAFTGQISHAQFYYLDKFILLAHDNELLLYAYHMDSVQTDLKRHTANSKYKLVHSTSMQCKQITSFSAINSFYSYLGLCCGSDKTLSVLDFNVGSVVARFKDIHLRSAHAIEQYKGTGDLQYSSSPNDLFITSAVCDGIKLWDLRSKRCERTFKEHRNRMHPCGVEFSPSGRYITTGSEDGQVYIYDIRQGLIEQNTDRISDCLLTPSFDPITSEVLYSTLTGEVIFYGHHDHNSSTNHHRNPTARNKVILGTM